MDFQSLFLIFTIPMIKKLLTLLVLVSPLSVSALTIADDSYVLFPSIQIDEADFNAVDHLDCEIEYETTLTDYNYHVDFNGS